MSSKLTAEGRADFARLEKTIREGLETFVEVGNALAEIKDRMLYKEVCSSFESYVQIRWGFSRRHAERQIAAAETVKLIGESGPIGPTPDSEAVARPLTEIPTELRAEVWREAVEDAGGEQPTAKHVAKAAAPHKPKKTAAQEARAREKRAQRAQQEPAPQAAPRSPSSEAETRKVPEATGVVSTEAEPMAGPNVVENGPNDGGPSEVGEPTGTVSSPVPELGTDATKVSGPNLTPAFVEGGAVSEAPSLPEHIVVALSVKHIPLTRAQLCAMTDEQESALTALGRFCQTTVAARRIALTKPAAAA